MNIRHFSIRYPEHPLTNLFNQIQDGNSPKANIPTLQGMAAGMVILLAHLHHLSHDEAIELMEEIAPQPMAAANDPAAGETRHGR